MKEKLTKAFFFFPWLVRYQLYRLLYGKGWPIKGYLGKPVYFNRLDRLKIKGEVGIFPGWRLEFIGPGIMSLGEGVRIGQNFHCIVGEDLIIKNNVIISSNVYIASHDYCLDKNYRGKFTDRNDINKKTCIGENSFVGYGAFVKAGVNIGNNVIIGANTIVTKDLPDGVTWCGK